MKKDIHPEYRPVVFHDLSNDDKFITQSTVVTKDTIEWEDGNTYPVVKVEVSSTSHPFYTGKQGAIRTTGRVERFNKKYGKKS
ncbi:50S ribosomal protein L31 type B [Fulvitalea axinellae]|uniref:Large ribosomal subunit protein bL31B n=1 Tax=Fulvitalea axinellae TaxID=1182444 RepID=A0AAU9CZY9_9BACT|nr:50S ribosomal protein L31 type B [Fulvitalea axinellae]